MFGKPQSLFIGVVGAVNSNVRSQVFRLSRVDDTLEVFPCHGIGGMVGMLLTGVFASKAINQALLHIGSKTNSSCSKGECNSLHEDTRHQ